MVGGPSTRAAIPEWVGGLLRYCRAHHCRVSFISYHANLLPTEPIAGISVRLRELRKLVDRYRDLGLRRIVVNESVGPVDQYSPGSIIGYLAQLEAGGADAAARSCWPGLHGEDNCTNGTLEGLLTPERSAAERVVGVPGVRRGGGGARAERLGHGDRGVAGERAPGHRRGRARAVSTAPPRQRRRSRWSSSCTACGAPRRARGPAWSRCERLPNSGDQPLLEPQPVSSRRVRLGEELTFRPGALGPNEALVVKVQSPAA